MFEKDNLADLQKNEKVSVSLHKLEKELRGVDLIAKQLGTDLRVS